ncbi:zinc-dependent metalloprotease [bacterium]|nr:zinc-dependent metalloprotease [bacterium]
MALSSISSGVSFPRSAAQSLGTPDHKPAEAHPHETFSPGTAPAPEMKAAAAAQPVDPTQDAQEIPGFFKILKKNDKVWFAINPEQLKKPFFFSANVAQSLGEKGLVGSEMADSQLAEFRLAGNQVQLVAKNTSFFADAGTPQEQFVKEGFADSLLASAPVVASKRANGEIVVEANALLFTDIPAYQARLAHTYDTPFALDVKNTSFTGMDNNEEQTSFGVQANYQAPAIPPKTGSLPSTTPDARSALVEFRYSFSKLPDTPMTPRMADDRIGHFVTARKDYTGDDSDGKVRYVNRWRLEKKDPDAPLSEPVKPITYWVAKDVPEKYRESVKAGVLEWNKAFEKIGFKDAIVVKQQTNDDKFDTMDARHASIRWYTAADVGSAVGPSQVDPRSGEILDADIRMADVFGRSAQKFLVDNPPAEHEHDHAHGDHHCAYLHHAGVEQAFARELLDARGDSQAGQQLAQAYVKDVVMHEVGHTLGLRHNFKGSLANDATQLQDAEHTKEHGLGTSVMDYHPFNLAAPGEKQGEYVQSSLGKYDYLAIKYAYEPLPADREKDALAAIAAQTTTDPQLAYESDEAADASDPEVNRFDLGSDPLAFAQKQVVLGKELWRRAQDKVLPEGAPYQELTGAFLSGLNKMSSSGTLMARYIGGVTLNRDHAGTDKATYEPVPAEKQRQAFQSILSTYFQPDSFKFKPEFVARLARDRFETWGDQNIFVGKAVVNMQAGVMNKLLATDRAQRLIDAPEKLPEGTDTMTLGEIYEGLQSALFSEVVAKKEISQSRRDLQREYIKSVQTILAPDSKAPGDAISMMRYQANQLKKQLDDAAKGSLNLQTRAHLENCSQMLNRALNPDA